jgi:hypothetical protein
MIPANGSHYVQFEKNGKGYSPSLPVIAWDDDGFPLVINRGMLRRAYDLGSVARIQQDHVPVVGAVPGGGWLIDCTDDEGNSWTTPILAWTVHADGTATPLTSDSDGVTSDATEGLASHRIYHPDATDVQSSE